MTCQQFEKDQWVYTFCAEEPSTAANCLRAVLRARIVDEITGEAPTAKLSLRTNLPNLAPRVATGGIVGLVGNPQRLYPGLDQWTVDIKLIVTAKRYVAREIRKSLGPINNFPNQFQPLDLGDEPFHREAVAIRGRLINQSGLRPTPLADVTVRIDGVWNTFPRADQDPDGTMDSANLICLTPGFYTERSTNTDILRRREMVLAVGEEKTLIKPAARGDTTIRITNRFNLNIGDVLALDPGHKELVEYLTVTSIDGAFHNDQPAFVTLAYPLSSDHREGTPAMRATPQAQGLDVPLARNAFAGDRPVFLTGLNDLATATVAEITGTGITPAEFHAVSHYEGKSSADGYFRLPPVSRVAQLRLRAEGGGLPHPIATTLSPDYEHYENRVDVIYRPDGVPL